MKTTASKLIRWAGLSAVVGGSLFVAIQRGWKLGRHTPPDVALFDVTRGNQLTGEERVEQPANIDTEVVLNKLRIELRVVRDLDRTRRSEQLAQWCHRFVSFHILSNEMVQVDDVDAIRRGELNQTEARRVRIKIGCLGIEPDSMFGGEFVNSALQLFGVGDDLVLRVHWLR